VVRGYDAKRSVFDILYEDEDEEEVDFLELCVSVVYCKRKRNILWNVRVFRGIIEALKQQPRPI